MASSGPADNYYQAVYDRLMHLDADGKPSPGLATEWSYDETGLRLSLTLRDGVTFTDGTAFDADAVKANLEKAKASSGEAGSALRAVDHVEVVDATHADIVLSRPDPGLVDALARSSGFMASPTALASPDLATAPVGSGPYVLDGTRPPPAATTSTPATRTTGTPTPSRTTRWRSSSSTTRPPRSTGCGRASSPPSAGSAQLTSSPAPRAPG